jgi:hypothetical protein
MTVAAGPARAARSHAGQRGTATLLVATLLVALLAGGGVALYVQLQSTKGAGMVKAARSSLYCAEAGLAVARPMISTQYLDWPLVLDSITTNQPIWYPITGISGDLDGDSVDDFNVTMRDNDDEVPPAANDPERDIDRKVLVVSRCIKDAAVSREITELLEVATGGHTYRNQGGGGAFNAGNQNQGP